MNYFALPTLIIVYEFFWFLELVAEVVYSDCGPAGKLPLGTAYDHTPQ